MSHGALNFGGKIHDLPKHLESMLPKFDLHKSFGLEDHIQNFYLVVKLMNVENEDVLCRLFPYTFKNKASTWYYSLPMGSITNWNDFEKEFVNKFGEEKNPTTLMK
jgi:hypothetical protein